MAEPADSAAPAPPRGRAGVALGFALAALVASWNPVAAPFGLVVGASAAMLSVRALRRGARRGVGVAALATSLIAVAASVAILLLTAGAVGSDLPGEPVVKAPSAQELQALLSDAGAHTQARRERAAQELDRLVGEGHDAGPQRGRGGPRDGGSPPR